MAPVREKTHGVGANRDGLRTRILSALVLAPLPLAAIWFGGVWLALLTAVAGAVMAWEWARLCRGVAAIRAPLGAGGTALIATVVVAAAAAAAGVAAAAIAVAVLGSALVFAITARAGGAPFWAALGTLWVALPCVGLLWLDHRDDGRLTLLWLFAVVWATDIGAYACGRVIGGARLAPRLSPRKTWAGLVGGVLCAMLAGGGTALAAGLEPLFPPVLISAGLAIVAQFGDLAESLAKRRFGVKDASSLIPGHGGLLDRLDGLLAVIPAVALMTLFGGRSVLSWH